LFEVSSNSPISLHLSAAGETKEQHAVLVFKTSEAATKATAFSGELLGSTVSVVMASALPGESKSTGATVATKAKDNITSLLASGYVTGSSGAAAGSAHIHRFDEQHNISLRVQIAAEQAKAKIMETDAQLGVSAKVTGGVEAARLKAAEIDEKYELSRKASETAAAAKAKATESYDAAMKNEKFRKSVNAVSSMWGSFTSSASAFGKSVSDTTKEKVAEKQAAKEAAKIAATAEPSAAAEGGEAAAAPAAEAAAAPTTEAAAAPATEAAAAPAAPAAAESS
jgi:hypothetical protein